MNEKPGSATDERHLSKKLLAALDAFKPIIRKSHNLAADVEEFCEKLVAMGEEKQEIDFAEAEKLEGDDPRILIAELVADILVRYPDADLRGKFGRLAEILRRQDIILRQKACPSLNI